MTDDLRDKLARKVRDRLLLRLGPNTVDLIKAGQTDIRLNSGEADAVAEVALEVLGEDLKDLAMLREAAGIISRNDWYGKLATAEERLNAVDALHQPKVFPVTHVCEVHNRPRLSDSSAIRACPDCVHGHVVECSHRGCCNWPCDTHCALHDETKETCVHSV